MIIDHRREGRIGAVEHREAVGETGGQVRGTEHEHRIRVGARHQPTGVCGDERAADRLAGQVDASRAGDPTQTLQRPVHQRGFDGNHVEALGQRAMGVVDRAAPGAPIADRPAGQKG